MSYTTSVSEKIERERERERERQRGKKYKIGWGVKIISQMESRNKKKLVNLLFFVEHSETENLIAETKKPFLK